MPDPKLPTNDEAIDPKTPQKDPAEDPEDNLQAIPSEAPRIDDPFLVQAHKF